ncbi:MAG: endolytic transglycosylase MltG [Candidatus Eremiobacteraeota bacterium]|nr:endolytic transglycosylase MltG [Candidatus Eremiobacteraeota bacterium]
MRRAGVGLAWAFVVVAVIAGLGLWLTYADRRFPAAPTSVDIAPGASVDDIVGQLKDSGVVSSSRLLLFYLRAQHLTSAIQAAAYDFPAHRTISEVAELLKAGGHPSAVWITVPEGYTAAQIADRLARRGLVEAPYFLFEVHSSSLTIAGARTRGLEGYLFPDTYLVPRHTTARTIAALMTKQFLRQLPARHVQLARRLGYKVPQIVTVASMVEREAKVDNERALIAAVIYNRLRRGMPLEIDATIEYALPRHKNRLSFHDLALDSPYNTYQHAGLPPTPIANPGRKSLLAAFHPATVDYLYYVYRGGGRHQFSRTLEEQQAAERKYLH